jgi:TrmH family RNA methyltransferase
LTEAALGARHRELTRLRTLARDRSARDQAGLVVIDGPRAIDGALARAASIETLYVDVEAHGAAADVADRAAAGGIAVHQVAPGAIARAGDVRANAGVIALARRPERPTRDVLEHGDRWVVCAEINDPGNLGTLMRSAEAAGATGIVVAPGSVDAYNPKTVRASAGAVFGIVVLEEYIVTVLNDLAAHGVHRIGAVSEGGIAPWDCQPPGRVAVVLGHETRGLSGLPVDELVTVPMAGAAESLNVAMAGTVLLFDLFHRAESA